MVGRTAYEEGENTTRGASLGAFCRCGAWRGCLGLEPTPDLYVAHIVEVFREVRRVLRDDGTLWFNIGDSYANDGKWGGETGGLQAYLPDADRRRDGRSKRLTGLKAKDMVGIPWRVAFALQADGWWLRSDIIEEVELYCPCGCGYIMEERIWRYSQDRDVIWSKPNPMPESVTDRPTKSHEYLFLLAKSERYYYDAEAIKEQAIWGQPNSPESIKSPYGQGFTRRSNNFNRNGVRLSHAEGSSERYVATESTRRNRRTVWEIATQPYPEAHFATFPEALVEPCVLAGCPEGGTVLDPFAGSGTVGEVCHRLGRRFVGLDLKDDYCRMAYERTAQLGLL